MKYRRRLAAVTAVSLSMLGACSDDDDSADPPSTSAQETVTESSPPTSSPPTTSSTTTTTEVPTTTAASTTPPTSTPSTIAPDDWEAILEGLARRRVELYAAPDVSRIGEYCAPDTDCATRLETQLSDAATKGQHIEGQQPFDVIAIEQALVSEPSPAARVANVVFVIAPDNPPPARLVDSAGNVVDEFVLNTSKSRVAFTLASWESDPALPWRVVLAETLGSVP
jgi:hypothetical protein